MRQPRVVGYIDDRGEIHEGSIPVLVPPKKSSPFGSSWVQMSQEFEIAFAKRTDVPKEAYRVCGYLKGRLDFQNFIRVPQTEIARELSLHPSNVNRALRVLERIGVLIPGPQPSCWRFNPHFGWKGSISSLRKAQREHPHLELVK